jgi:hypothetical protein
MIDKLAQRAWCLAAVALLTALLISSCTSPLPPRRQIQAGAGGVALTPAAIPPITATTTITAAVPTVAPFVAITGTTPVTRLTIVATAIQTTTAPAARPTTAVTSRATVSPALTIATAPAVTTTRVAARLTPSQTVTAPPETATPVAATAISLAATSTPTTSTATLAPTLTPRPSPTTAATLIPSPSTTWTATTAPMPPTTPPAPIPSSSTTWTATAALIPTTTASPTTRATLTAAPPSTSTATPRLVVTSVLTQTVEVAPTAFLEAAPTAPAETIATPPTSPTEPPVLPPTLVEPATPPPPTATPFPLRPLTYKTGDVLKNGDFQGGFDPSGIANNWQGFSRVAGVFGWSDETYPTLLFESPHAQMMRIRSTQYPDAYVGIYQNAAVVKGRPYELALHGLIRSTEGSPQKSSWAYRLQWGIDLKGRNNWQSVAEWTDLGWDDQPIGAPNPTIDQYQTTVTPTGNTLTVFVRGWRKWVTPTSAGEFVIDAVHLTGPMPIPATTARLSITGADLTK